MSISKEKIEQWRRQHQTGKRYSTNTPEFRKAVEQTAAELNEPWTAEYFLIRPVRIATAEPETLPPHVVSLFEKQRDSFGRPGVFETLFDIYRSDFHTLEDFYIKDKTGKVRNRVEFVGAGTLQGSYRLVAMRLANSGRLRDKTEEGQAILILDRKPEPLAGCIGVMLHIALAKGWVEIEGEGTGDFLLSLWPQAESLGIVVKPRPEQQDAWQQYQIEKQKKQLAEQIKHDAIYPEDQAAAEAAILAGQVQTSASLPPKKPKL